MQIPITPPMPSRPLNPVRAMRAQESGCKLTWMDQYSIKYRVYETRLGENMELPEEDLEFAKQERREILKCWEAYESCVY